MLHPSRTGKLLLRKKNVPMQAKRSPKGLLCQAKVDADGLCMSNMQIAIRLWREPRQDLVESLTSGNQRLACGGSSNCTGAFWPWQRPPFAKSVSILTATDYWLPNCAGVLQFFLPRHHFSRKLRPSEVSFKDSPQSSAGFNATNA